MDTMILKGIEPYDGEYDLDLSRGFTMIEWRWVKKISGYMPATVEEGLRGGDPDLVLALAIIALVRAGRVQRDDVFTVSDQIAESPFDGMSITFRGGADAVPPPVGQKPSLVSDENKNGSSDTSGDDSTKPSGESGSGQSHIGSRLSATSATSGSVTSRA